MKIKKITIRQLNLPLIRPYRLSYRTFHEFEPYMVEVMSDDGSIGWGDGHISPGSSIETRAGGWKFLQQLCRKLIGQDLLEAMAMADTHWSNSKVATSAIMTALEGLSHSSIIEVPRLISLPLLTPINSHELNDIPNEIETLIADGFRTFKVKVGENVDADLARVAMIQRCVGGRATLRLDANRAFTAEQGCTFASALDSEAIELFEQPCHADDWEANERVAAVSKVPLMLDEPICSLSDIVRAADIKNVKFCKLKLKRFGSMSRLKAGLEAVRANGMEPVLGDGLGSEITSWMEACVAQTTIRNAGEFNGFLKSNLRLFNNPITFNRGSIELPERYLPDLNLSLIDQLTTRKQEFSN